MNTTLQTAPVHFSDTELAEDPAYRSLSRIALLSLILAVFTPVAIFSPLLWPLPVVVAVVALVAIRQVQSRPTELSGAGLTKIALFAALTIGSFAVVRQFTRDYILYRQARIFSDQFFALMNEGKLREAFLLHVDFPSRQETLDELKAPPREVSNSSTGGMDAAMVAMMERMHGPREQEKRFLQSHLLRYYSEPTPRPEVEYAGNIKIDSLADDVDHVVLRYRAKIYEREGQASIRMYEVVLTRELNPDLHEGQWRLEGIKDL